MTLSPRNHSVFVSEILVLCSFILDQTINQVYVASAPSKIDFLAGDAVQSKLQTYPAVIPIDRRQSIMI